ncbi:MAG: ParB N-terminal domain-containing protein [Planctomycetes bacterium]|nr:ParB N-terminal domain-containing protein [Planctomycetota bacterium]
MTRGIAMDESDRRLCWLDVEELLRSPPFPPRTEDPSSGLLLSSVRLHGVINPVLVRPAPAGHQVVCGYRRLLAARAAGLKRIPAVIAELTDAEAIRCFLAENTCRSDLEEPVRGRALSMLREMREGLARPAGGSSPRDARAARARWSPPPGGEPGDLELPARAEWADPSKVEGLIEKVEDLFGEARERKRIDMTRSRNIVEELLALQERSGVLTPADVYAGGRESWLAPHALLSASLGAAIAPAEWMQLRRWEYALAGLLHDIGMVFLDHPAFRKLARLEPRQKKDVQSHTRLGHALILGEGKEWAELALVARDHHERLDGSGYPNGLKGGELRRLVRAIALVDSYASLTGLRPYRRTLSCRLALDRLARGAETGHYDPTLFPLLHAAAQPVPAISAVAAGETPEETPPPDPRPVRKTPLALEFY